MYISCRANSNSMARDAAAVPVVIHDQDAAGAAPSARRPSARTVAAIRRQSFRVGSRTTNSLPRPGPSLNASTDPPCISTRRLTSVKPMPSPPWDRSNVRSTCVNIPKILSQLVGRDAHAGILDRHDDISGCPAARLAVSQMRPPGSVYLQALLRRLPNTWARRTGSASSWIGSGGSVTVNSCFDRSASGRHASRQ